MAEVDTLLEEATAAEDRMEDPEDPLQAAGVARWARCEVVPLA